MKKIVYFIDTYKPKIPTRYSYFYDQFMSKLNKSNLKKQLKLIKRLQRNKKYDVVVYGLDNEAECFLSKHLNVAEFKKGSGVLKKTKYSRKKSLELIRKMVINDNGLSILLNYKSCSLLDLNEQDIWDGYADEVVKNIDVIDLVIKNEKPNIVYSSSECIISEIIHEICSVKDIRFRNNVSFLLKKWKNVFNMVLPLGLCLSKPPLKVEVKDKSSRGNKINPNKTNTNKTNKVGKKKLILFAEIYYESQVQVLLDLESKLDKEFDLLIIGLNDIGEEIFKKYGIKFRKISNYISPTIYKKYKKAAGWNKTKHDWFKKYALGGKIKYKDVNILKNLSYVFKYLFMKKFQETILYIEVMNRILDIEKPNVILLTEYNKRFCRTIARVASRLNIRSVTIQHGMLADLPQLSPIVTDKFLVYGDKFKNVLVKNYGDPKKVVLVGMPRSDVIVSKKYDKKKIFSDLDISNGNKEEKKNKVICFLSQPFDIEYKTKLLKIIYSGLKKIREEELEKESDINIIVKLHPQEDGKINKKIAHDCGLKIKIVKDYDLLNIIHCSDIVIAIASTTIFDSVIMNKPVISVNPSDKYIKLGYVPTEIVLNVINEKELVDTINNIYTGKTKAKDKLVKKYIKSNFYKLDGKVSDRIVKSIRKTM